MGRQDNHRANGDIQLGVHEHRPAIGQFGHDMVVVHDLLADIDRGAEMLQCTLDGVDCTIDTGAVSARRCQEKFCRRHQVNATGRSCARAPGVAIAHQLHRVVLGGSRPGAADLDGDRPAVGLDCGARVRERHGARDAVVGE